MFIIRLYEKIRLEKEKDYQGYLDSGCHYYGFLDGIFYCRPNLHEIKLLPIARLINRP
jgi:hypothetical protein